MFYKEVKVEQPKKGNTRWRNFDQESTPPKDVGRMLVGGLDMVQDQQSELTMSGSVSGPPR
eukprot:4536843-Prorocentrum_lima.AAC.1